MANISDVEKLYNALKRDGYDDLGTLDEFTSRVSDRDKARKLYEAMQRDGYDDLGTADNFYGRLNPQPAYKPTADELAGFQNTISQAQQTVRGSQQAARRIDVRQKRTGLDVPGANGLNGSDVQYGRVELGKNRKVVATDPHYNLESGQMESAYITEQGNEYGSRAGADIEQNAVDIAKRQMTLPGQLEDAYAERERLQAEIDAETQRIGYGQTAERSYAPQVPGSIPRQSAERLSNDRLQTLYAAQRQNEERITALEAERDDDGGTQFWRGFLDAAKNPSTWTFGVTDFQNMTQLMRIKGKVDNGEELTDDEETLLKNTMANGYAQQMFGENRGFMYRAGGISMQALPFVAEFYATGGFSTLTKMGANAGTRVAEKFALEGLKKTILRNTGVVMGDIASSFIMANTTGAARTGADIMERHIGQVTMDDNGQYQFENGKGIGQSIYEGEVASTLEYYTEKLGEHLQLGNWIAKGTDKMGLSTLSKAVRYLSNSKMLNAGGIQDYPTEVVEEQANLLLNAILVGDNNFNGPSDPHSVINPKTQLDIWGGMLFSIGLMQAPRLAHTGYNAAGYYAYKHTTDVADANASIVFGADNWQMIKEQIDNCDNEHLSELLQTVIDGGMNDMQKTATLNYASNLLKMRGYNNGMMADVRGGEDFQSEEGFLSHGIDQSYQQGHEAQEPNDKKMIIDEANEAEARLSEMFGEEDVRFITNCEPMTAINIMLSHRGTNPGEWNDDEIAAVVDYYQKQARAQGVMDAAADDVEYQVAKANAEVDANTHKVLNQMIMAESGGEQFYIVGGDVSLIEDVQEGKFTFDAENTGDALIVRNADTGEIGVKSPQMLSVNLVSDPNQLKMINETQLRQEVTQQHDNEITFGNPAQEVFQLNDTVTLNDGQGNIIEGEIGMMPASIDGVYVVYTVDGRAMQLTADELNKMIVAHNGMEVERSTMQPPVMQPEEAELDNAGGEAGANADTGANEPPATASEPQPEPEQKQSALDRIPVLQDASGKPILNRKGKKQYQWHKASVDDTADALTETTGGDMVMARDTATDLINNARGKLEKIRKQKPKGDDPIEIAESRAEIKRQEQEQQDIISHWQKVNQTIQQRMQAESARRQAEIEAAKSEQQRAQEAEEARIRKEKQDEIDRQRLRESIERDRKRRNKEYEPLVQARKDMADDADAMAVLQDTEPRDLREWVSSLLRPHSILWQNASESEIGLRSELGLQRADMQRFMTLLGNKENGAVPFGKAVLDIYEGLPEGLKEQYTDQDVRNVVLELFQSASNSRKMMNLTAENRIAEAREMQKENRRREAEWEMEAWCESYHLTPEERATFEDFMSTEPPYAVEEDIINQIIADNEQNRTSSELDSPDVSGGNEGELEGGESQVQGTVEAAGDGTHEEGPHEAAEAATGESPVSDDTVFGGASAERETVAVLLDQIGASAELSERMSDYEVEQMNALIEDWDAVNSDYGEVIEQQKQALQSKNKATRDAAQKVVDEAQAKANEAFEPIGMYVEELNVKYGIGKEEPFEGAIPTPKMDKPRMQAIRKALTDAYRSGDKEAIQRAAKRMQEYVDEGLDDYAEGELVDDYETNDPTILTEQYIQAVFLDRYVDDDEDQEYIKTGLKASMRQQAAPQQPIGRTSTPEEIKAEEAKVDTNPTDAQKEAGNYQKGHINIDGYDITIENPKGSTRSGVDANGNRWESTMHNTYGYIRGTEGVDGDHIDVFLSDNPTSGKVFVVDQVNPSTGDFDEHKVMYGFASEEEARQAYLSNYDEGWQGLGKITEVSREEFKKWIEANNLKKADGSAQDTTPANPSGNKLVTDERYEQLRERMKKKLLGQMNMGIDPEILAIGTEMAVYHIEKGARAFAEYAKGMIADLGDAIRPYLKAFYNGARDLPEMGELSQTMDSYDEVSKFDVFNFDKQKAPTPVEKAQQVVSQKKADAEAAEAVKKIQEIAKKGSPKKGSKKAQQVQPPSLFDMFEEETKPAKQETPAQPQQTVLRLRPATDADIDSRNPVYYHQGKRVYIVAVMRSGEQISGEQISKPKIDSIMLTNGKSVKLEDLQVEDKGAQQPAKKKDKTPWWNDPNMPSSISLSDYRTYMTDEARRYFASHPAFDSWKRKDLAFVTAAVWDGVVVPYEALKDLPEIVAAEQTVKDATANGVLQITDEERDQHAQHLLDAEHGSAIFENGKIKKVKGVQDFSGPVRQERKALLIIGYPAAGKSSVFANRLSNEQGARIIDSDIVKPWLEGFDGGNGAGYVQNASSEVAERAIDIAVGRGDNIILPRIGGGSVIILSAALKLAGYDVQLYFNDVATVTSVDRATSRFAETGRYLSLQYLTSKDGVPSKNFSKFTKQKIGDYINELSEGKVQELRGRLGRLLESETVDGKRLWESSASDQGGYSTLDEYLSVLLGTEGTRISSGTGDLIFSYAEWKSNDVAFGEKPKEIWNSKSGKPMPGTVKKNSNEGEQKVSGKPESVGQGAEQASGATGRTGTERSPEQNRAERSGSEYSVEDTVSRVPDEGEETRDSSGGPGRRSGSNARVSATTFHKNKRNNVGERGKDYAPLSPKARFNANVQAIKIMRLLVDEGVEVPTKDQMEALRQYSGWGGMGTFFNDETSAENKILRDLLSEEEYNDAVLSIKTAYYTPATVIDTLWDMAKAAGFKGGNVLEGSAGIGNIIGQMPREMSRRSDIEAVELDTISGNILKLLYPDAKVHIQGFQETVIPNGTVDLAITNVPFAADISVIDKVDKDLSRQFRQLHDFCIAKNIRKLKEGGIGIFITTSGTLDKSTKLREWIPDGGQSDVIGAFRLHNKTFGGTNVTSDIIVVRKRVNGQKSPNAIDISKATPLRVGTYDDKFGHEHQASMVVNDYFKTNPDMMAGEMAFGYEKGDTYRPGSYGLFPVDGKNQEEMLKRFVKKVTDEMKYLDSLTELINKTEQQPVTNQLTAEKEGRMLIDGNGRLCVSERGVAVPLALNATKVKGQTKEQCFKDYQDVQKAVDDVLQQQLSDPDDAALKPKIDALNKAFDKFVKRYGNLHKNVSIAFLRNDIDFPSFLALENYSESKDINGKVTVTTRKAPLFSQRVLGFKTEPQPKNVKDAVTASIFRSNTIDVRWIAERLGKSEEDVRREILDNRLGFEDPSTMQLEIRYKYLCGNVREKLVIAEAYNKDGKYAANVEELRKAVPMDIPAHLIDFSLGSSWIPKEIYTDYLKEVYDLDDAKLNHIEGSWVLNEGYGYRNEKNRAAGIYSEQFRETIYGHQIVMAALNNRPIKVQKQMSEGYGSSKTTRTITDQASTQACAVRVDEIKDEFKQFAKKKMQDNPELSAQVEKIYNEKFNALVPMQIDDEFLPGVFEGANMNIHLYGHQKRGVMRGLTSPTMLAHEVGTGKSFTLISTAMEMKRLGTAKKPMVVVQNATVAQMTADAKLLYPNARVLSLSEKDRSAEGRRSFYAKIKYNDWDLIIVPQSTFERIPDSPERELQFIQEKIDEKKHVIEAAEQSGMDEREIDRLRKELEKIEQEYGDTFFDNDPANKKGKKKDAKQEAASLEKAKVKAQEQLDRAVDDVQYFDDLGVDALLVDEAHEYKHLGFQTSIGRGIKGIDPSYSKKCAGLYNKTRSVFEKAGWKNVVFATGTPISNTAAEIWTFMKYLMPADVMRANDIYYFDDFVHNFGKIEQHTEFQTNGKYREVTRFLGYGNKPELIRIWSQVADTVLTSDVGAVKEKIPEQEGGKDLDVFLPQSPSLIRIMNAVRKELERFENMTGKEKKENCSIPLTMYGIAKRAAIDPRLVDAEAHDEPRSKTNAAVKEILKDLEATKNYKGTVAVFCDNQNRLGKKGGKNTVEFNIYDDMKAKLIAAGVPESQIAIIKSGMSITAKQKVFDAVNNGDIRVVLGSTQTLGTGVNMQERLHLLIHIDAPDRPMDYTQRDGRIKRQGNLHKTWGKTIRVLRFSVEDSLDVTAYQRLKTKSAFIDSIMDGKGALLNNQVDRTVEEEEEGLFDNPVAVLSGSQYALKKNQAERELRKYQSKRAQWQADQIYVSNALRQNKATLAYAQSQIADEEKQLAHIRSLFPNGTVGTITVEGVKIDMSEGDAALGKLTKTIKEKINDPVNATVKKLRENQIYNDEVLDFTIELDGHKVNFKVSVEREAVYENGKMRTVVHKYSTFESRSLGIDALMKSSKSVGDHLNDILDEVVSGRDNTDRIEAYKAKIERINSENEQLQKRVGMEFQFDKELEQARKNVEEYTELMKQEMKEKEAKYAAQQEEAGDGGFDLRKAEDSEEEDEVLYSAAEDYESELVSRVRAALEAEHPGFNDAFLIDEGVETRQAVLWVNNRDAAMQMYKAEHPDAKGDYYFATYMWGRELFEEKMADPSLQDEQGALPDFAVDAEQQHWDIIGTDSFKNFFGDWQNDPGNASKVVDADGKPLIVYHGTNLTEVNKGKPFYEFYPGSHFGTVGQSQNVISETAGRTKTYPVYLNIRNPKRVQDTPEDWEGTHSEWWEKQIRRAKEQGYDGLVYLNKYEGRQHPADSWIAFYPEQVKSARENIGTYDPTNPDIRYREAERFREGQTFPIHAEGESYTIDLMPDVYDSKQQLLEAIRRQYPEYFATIDGEDVRMQSWRAALGDARKARTAKQVRGAENYIERKTRNAVNAVTEMAKRMSLDVEILTTIDGLEGKKARSKGWINPRTGKITLVLPNNANLSDLINTLLHEGVAHYGLRKMFGKSFDTFLDNVYNNVPVDIRAIIDASMKRNKWSQHKATEEYLARLAERTDFEHATQQGWWSKIKEFFIEMLGKIGFNISLSDNDLRYVLWRSYENLLHPEKYRTIFDDARETAMQAKLQVGKFARERDRLQRTGRVDTSQIAAAADMGLLFRDDDDDIAKSIYEDFVAKDSFKFKENWQDSMASLKAIQKAIAAETGKVATGAEDAYRFENRMHGRAKNMTEKYDYNFYRPMLKAFHEFCKHCHMGIEHGMDYLISKSGLERNVYYAFRDAARAKITDEINEERSDLEKQYAKGKMSDDDYKVKKQELEEREHSGVDDFMQQIRSMFVYQHAKQQYEDGIIDYTEYLRIIEHVISGQLKRKKPRKDADGSIISDNYYDEQVKDYSGLTETFAKDMYDDAQSVKKQAQRAIDPDERKALWNEYNEKMRQAYGVARQVAEDQVFVAEQYGDAVETHQQTKRLWDAINAATKETLRHSYESGMIDRNNYYKVRDMFDWYIPLRGWEEDKASDVYTYMGRDNVFSPAVKKVWGRQSKAENPLAYVGNIAVSTILSGHRNQLKQHFLNYVMNNPTSLVSISESWYENIAAYGDAPVWVLRTADTAGKAPDEIAQIVNDFNEEMVQKQREGKAMPVRGRLRLDVHATQGQKSEHVVEVQRAGHTYLLYINGDPKAAQALNGSAARAVSRISDTWLGKKITKINHDMAAFFTSKNPAFVVSNLSRDLNMAGASVAINEGKEYNARFIANVAKVLRPRMGESSKWVPASKQPTGLMPSLMRKWQNGSLNLRDETERLFGEFMDEGGETGFVNMLSIDSFKERMQKEIREMNGSSLFGAKAKVKECTTRKGLRLLGETFEFYNRCAEDATRFIVYMTSRQMGKTLEESISDAKDVTLNFNRKGTGGMGNAEVRDLFIFVNPAIQALANMYRMSAHKPLKFGSVTAAFVAGGLLIPVINQWLLQLFGDDDDKQAYWNLPPWVRKNNLVLWIPGTKNFLTIPLAQEFRVFYGVGEMISSAIMDHPVDKWGLEIFSSVADLVPINPTGNGGNLMVDLAPTMVQPLMQVGENIDFTGKPIWRDNQGNKHAPMYSKAYVSTPHWMVKLSEGLNTVTGGNEGRKGFVERNAPIWGDYINNPAVWNHLLQGYFGGMYNTLAKTADVVATTASGELPKIYQTPVINRFLNRPVERNNAGVLGEEYYSLINERDEVQYEVRTWKRKASDGDADAQRKLDELMQSERYKRAEVISHYEKILKDLKAGERAIKEGAPHSDKDLHDIHTSMDFYKAEMAEELAAIGDGKKPLDAAIEKFNNAKSFAEKNRLRLRIERLMMEDANGKKVGRNSDVEKAVAYLRGEEVESRKTAEQYLMLATGDDMAADARIRAAKARIKQVTDEYKKMLADGRTEEAAAYREKHSKWFAAENIINGQQRGIATNKKLLGKGYDSNIMQLISAQRDRMLKSVEGLE